MSPLTTSSITALTSPATAQRQTGSILGKDDFLKLLVTQLRNQDPLSPVDQNEFIAQTAQFTSLEELQNIRKALEAQQMAKNAEGKISGVETSLNQKISNIDSYKPVENASVNFKFNQAELSDEAKASLDQLAGKVKDSKGYVLEIQGFTDSRGADAYNLALSQKRSENVVRYLSQQHQVPLFRMFILGLGEAKQIEDNKTKEGRAANRRVEITLLKSAIESMSSGR